jgi:hypothetical protein
MTPRLDHNRGILGLGLKQRADNKGNYSDDTQADGGDSGTESVPTASFFNPPSRRNSLPAVARTTHKLQPTPNCHPHAQP